MRLTVDLFSTRYAVIPQGLYMAHTPPLILLTNHDQYYLDLIDELLTEEGYHVHIEMEMDKAYMFVRNQKPDVIILDIPIMHPDKAWTILNMIQLNPQTRHIPTLICSTNLHMMSTIMPHLEAMGCETLAKPFHLEDILAKIQKLLGT